MSEAEIDYYFSLLFCNFTHTNRNLCVTNCDALSSILNLNIVTMKRVAIFIAFMLIGFTSCDKLRDDSHFIHDGYKVMYGEYEVTSVISFQEMMPKHLIEPATAKIQEGRLLQDGSKLTIYQDMTYSLKESDLVVSSGRYAIGVYENANCEEKCYYYPGPSSFMGYLKLMDNNGDTMYFEMQVSAHEDKTKCYGIPWAYQSFDIQEGDMSYHYGIRYGLIYCE